MTTSSWFTRTSIRAKQFACDGADRNALQNVARTTPSKLKTSAMAHVKQCTAFASNIMLLTGSTRQQYYRTSCHLRKGSFCRKSSASSRKMDKFLSKCGGKACQTQESPTDLCSECVKTYHSTSSNHSIAKTQSKLSAIESFSNSASRTR